MSMSVLNSVTFVFFSKLTYNVVTNANRIRQQKAHQRDTFNESGIISSALVWWTEIRY